MRSFRTGLALALVVAAFSAQAALSIFPLAPTSTDPVRLRFAVTCWIGNESVTRTGKDIRVVLATGGCGSVPIPFAHEVSLGALPAGEYHVELTLDDQPSESLKFIVLEADPVVKVRPFVVPTGTSGFPLHLSFVEGFPLCGNANCDDWVIDIGGVKYRPGTPFYAPDLAPGLHDITITNSKATTVVPAAVYYHAPGGVPVPEIFERVLFPVLFSGGGAQGSQWRSEAVIASSSEEIPIENANTVEPPKQCLVPPCGERLAPKERRAFTGLQYPHGVALMVPRTEAANLDFGLRVRDVSREDDGFGTEIPVVRESEMFRDARLKLLDVPLDPRYRVKLRLYQFRDPIFEGQFNANDVGLRIVRPDGTRVEELYTRDFRRNCEGVACLWTPYYLELDLPARGEGERVDIEVTFDDGAYGWAFASITNNRTQQVTVVTP